MGSQGLGKEKTVGKIERGEELTEQVNRHIQNLQDQLAQGHSKEYLETLQWYAKLHKYSWGNTLLIASQCKHATVVAGYRRWQELGFQVKKGEQGIWIRSPWLRKELNPETGQKEEKLIGFFATCICDISQTEEYPAKQPPAFHQEVPGDFGDLYDHLQHRLSVMGITVEEHPLANGHHGFYETVSKRIVISSNLSTNLKITTLIHEAVHSVIHGTKDIALQWTTNEREWQAESVCYVVCRAIGMENVNSRDYLLSYRLTTDRLADMIQFIQRTTKQMLADLDLLQPIKASEALAAD